MIGAHDLGGAEGFGPIAALEDDAQFHAAWERKAFALTLAAGMLGHWNIDESRHARENQSPQRYLSNSYYETWLVGLQKLLIQKGLLNAEELAALPLAQSIAVAWENHSPSELRPQEVKALTREQALDSLRRGGPTELASQQAPLFAIGAKVRVLAMTQAGHTRAPSYVHDAVGTVQSYNGVHIYPDANAHSSPDTPTRGEPLYTVAFSRAALFQKEASAGFVMVDLWEPYLREA